MAAVGDFRFPLEASLTLGAWHEPSSAHQIEGDASARLPAPAPSPSSASLLRQRKAATTATTAAKREERKEENMKEEDEQKVEKKAKEEEGVYTLEEVGQHKGPTSYWIAVADSVYDVSAFVLSGRHPGGDLILQGTSPPSPGLRFRSFGRLGYSKYVAMFCVRDARNRHRGMQ